MNRNRLSSRSAIAASLIFFAASTPSQSQQSPQQQQQQLQQQLDKDFEKVSGELDCQLGKIPADAFRLQTANMQWSAKIPIDDDALTASTRKKACDAARQDKKNAMAIKARAQTATDCKKQMSSTIEDLDLLLSQAQMQIDRFCRL